MDVLGVSFVRYPLAGPDGDDATVLEFPGYRQTQSYTCGFVAGLMVLHGLLPQAGTRRFLRLVDPDPKWGTSTNRLIRSLRASGVVVGRRDGLGFDGVAEHIDAGLPLITTIRRAGRPGLHWVVLYGIGRSPRRVFVAGDSMRPPGSLARSWRELSHQWSPRGFALACWAK